MTRARDSATLAAISALALGSCNALWGIDDLDYSRRDGTVAQGGGHTGGAGGATPTAAAGGQAGAGGEATEWWKSAWSSRAKVSFDNAARSVALTNFPLPVVLDANRLAAFGANSTGADIRFVDADGETLLAHEIEQWSAAAGTCVWVRVPAIDAGSRDDHIWLYAGNPEAASGSDRASVWSDGFRAVWHLNEDTVDEASGTQHEDSTGNGNVGVQHGNGRTSVAGGSLAGAQRFDGDDDDIEIASGGLQITGTQLTIEARALAESAPHDFPHVVGAGSGGRHWQQYWNAAGAQVEHGWTSRLRVAGAGSQLLSATGALGSWANLASVYDGVAVKLYVDGQLAVSVPLLGTLDAIDTPVQIGNNPVLTPRAFAGVIDEVRISDVARSDDWLAAQHAAQTGSFVTVGPIELR